MISLDTDTNILNVTGSPQNQDLISLFADLLTPVQDDCPLYHPFTPLDYNSLPDAFATIQLLSLSLDKPTPSQLSSALLTIPDPSHCLGTVTFSITLSVNPSRNSIHPLNSPSPHSTSSLTLFAPIVTLDHLSQKFRSRLLNISHQYIVQNIQFSQISLQPSSSLLQRSILISLPLTVSPDSNAFLPAPAPLTLSSQSGSISISVTQMDSSRTRDNTEFTLLDGTAVPLPRYPKPIQFSVSGALLTDNSSSASLSAHDLLDSLCKNATPIEPVSWDRFSLPATTISSYELAWNGLYLSCKLSLSCTD